MKSLFQNNRRSISLSVVVLSASMAMIGCGDNAKPTEEKQSVKQTIEKKTPEKNNKAIKDTKKTPPVIKKLVKQPIYKVLDVKPAFDKKSQVLASIAGKERAFFSITPVRTEGKLVLLSVSPLIESNKPTAKDSLIFSIDGEPKSYSPQKGKPNGFVIEKAFLESLLTQKGTILIQLAVGDGLYYEGDLSVGKENSFRESLKHFLK